MLNISVLSRAGHAAQQLPHHSKGLLCLGESLGVFGHRLQTLEGVWDLPSCTGWVQGRSGTPQRVPWELPRPALLAPAVPPIPRTPQPFVAFSARYCSASHVFFIFEGPRGRRNAGGARRGRGRRKIEAACFLHRFTAQSLLECWTCCHFVSPVSDFWKVFQSS